MSDDQSLLSRRNALAGVGSGPGPLKVPTDQLQAMLGITSVSVVKHPSSLTLNDTALA
jgi:hypothetical protein